MVGLDRSSHEAASSTIVIRSATRQLSNSATQQLGNSATQQKVKTPPLEYSPIFNRGPRQRSPYARRGSRQRSPSWTSLEIPSSFSRSGTSSELHGDEPHNDVRSSDLLFAGSRRNEVPARRHWASSVICSPSCSLAGRALSTVGAPTCSAPRSILEAFFGRLPGTAFPHPHFRKIRIYLFPSCSQGPFR